MEANEMASWPSTPGPIRIRLAETLINTNGRAVDHYAETKIMPEDTAASQQTYEDASKILDLVDIYFFSTWAHETMAHLGNAEQINSGVDLLDIAKEANSDKFIGMVFHSPPEHEDDQPAYAITCLHRNPEWSGLNPQLPLCKGLEVHIYCQAETPEEPAIIIALPPGELQGADDSTHVQGILNESIRDSVMWHGATSCSQHTA